MNTKTCYIVIKSSLQQLLLYAGKRVLKTYPVSTAKNGLGERQGSYQTPRGWHEICEKFGADCPINSIFVARQASDEIYTPDAHADKDWVLTRILWLSGLEPGKNHGSDVDTKQRYIYIHGTNDEASLGKPVSRGCIRMANKDIIELFDLVTIKTKVFIE